MQSRRRCIPCSRPMLRQVTPCYPMAAASVSMPTEMYGPCWRRWRAAGSRRRIRVTGSRPAAGSAKDSKWAGLGGRGLLTCAGVSCGEREGAQGHRRPRITRRELAETQLADTCARPLSRTLSPAYLVGPAETQKAYKATEGRLHIASDMCV